MLTEKLEQWANETMQVLCMAFLDSKINLYSKHQVPVIQTVLTFFGSHFQYEDNAEKEPIADFYVDDYIQFEQEFEPYCKENGMPILLRKSSAKQFNLSAVLYETSGVKIYRYDDIKTALIMDKTNKRIFAFVSQSSEIALIELIRDLIIKDQENKGTLILHAAAVEKDGKAYAIAASKGSGKSTACLEFVMKYGYRIVSGDKVFVRVKEHNVYVKGWPDYPHLGMGTLRRFDELYDLIRSKVTKETTPRDKFILNPAEFYALPSIQVNADMLPLQCFLFPAFEEGQSSIKVGKLEDCVGDVIQNLEFKNDFPIAKWHDYIVVENDRKNIVERLEKALIHYNGYILSGNLNVTPEVIESLK